MADRRVRTATTLSQVLCAATLLFVFFLPLHFHFSLSPQLSSQCSCLPGTRTQFVVHDAAPVIAPVAQFAVLVDVHSCEWLSAVSSCQHIRGPPPSLAAA